MKTLNDHKKDVKNIQNQLDIYIKSGSKEKIIFTHVGSHSTREKSRHTYNNVDISHLNSIINIDEKNKVAHVEPSVTMLELLDETLKLGLMPEVVMEFSDITVGGAIEGAALESSSFKYGQFNDSCIEYEILLCDGKLIKANKSKNADIFYGKTGSYGSLGLLTSVKISLIESKKFVELNYHRFGKISDAIKYINKSRHKKIDFLDGIVFSEKNIVVMTGSLTNNPKNKVVKFTRAHDEWFYQHVIKVSESESEHEESVPLKDYYFRYDRAAYWMGQYFIKFVGGYNIITRTLFNQSLSTRRMYKALHLGNMSQMFFIQDFYIPLNKTKQFIDYTAKRINVFPIWLCPIKPTKNPEKLSPHYSEAEFLINVGFYGRSRKFAENYFESNRDVEKFASKLGARKMLYAHAYYTKKEFWQIYDLEWYNKLRNKYHSNKKLADVFERTHVNEKYKPRVILGAMKFYWKLLTQGKKF